MFSVGKKNGKFAIYLNDRVAVTTTKELDLNAVQVTSIKDLLNSMSSSESLFKHKTQKEIDNLIEWLLPIKSRRKPGFVTGT